MSLLHPSARVPAWVAIAVVATAYVVRSALRGWDFRPDVPTDVIVLAVLLALLALRELLRRQRWGSGGEDGA